MDIRTQPLQDAASFVPRGSSVVRSGTTRDFVLLDGGLKNSLPIFRSNSSDQ
jgi:hypothetical protein